MIRTLLVLGTAASLALAAGAASAGTCTSEIDALQKQLSSTDAGMGPTGKIEETGQLHPPTGAMNQATENKATSSEDVLSQNQGAPTDAEASADAAGVNDALQSLERARQFDQAGNEIACMNEIGSAKSKLGVQ